MGNNMSNSYSARRCHLSPIQMETVMYYKQLGYMVHVIMGFVAAIVLPVFKDTSTPKLVT